MSFTARRRQGLRGREWNRSFFRPRLESLEERNCPTLPPGWTVDGGGVADMTGSTFSSTGDLVTPTEGSYMLRLSSTGSTSTGSYSNQLGESGTRGTIVRGPSTTLSAGQTVSLDYWFSSYDYDPYNDFALGLVSGTTLFTMTQTSDWEYSTGWRTATMQVSQDGAYQLVLVASNEGDTSIETELFVDNLSGFDLPDLPGSPGPAEVQIAATTPSVPEAGPGVAQFTLTRTGDLSGPLTVTYYVYGSAAAGEDYAELTGEVTFAAGSDTATIDVQPIDDASGEYDESVT